MLIAILIDRDGDRALIAILIDRDRDRARQESGRGNAAASEQASGLVFVHGRVGVVKKRLSLCLHGKRMYAVVEVCCVPHNSLWDSRPSPLHSVGGFPAVSFCRVLICLEMR